MSQEIRRPSDTIPMDRDAIERALEVQHRDTLPLPVQAAIAEAQQLDATMCPACKAGLVSAEVAARIATVLDDDDDAPITAVEDVSTKPVKK